MKNREYVSIYGVLRVVEETVVKVSIKDASCEKRQ
jgi:hypothetical protein